MITKTEDCGGCTAKTVKNGAKWERMDKLMIKGEFFSSRSRVQPGLPDLSNLSLSREAGRLIQLRLAESEKWHGLVVVSNVSFLISWWWWPGPGGGELCQVTEKARQASGVGSVDQTLGWRSGIFLLFVS